MPCYVGAAEEVQGMQEVGGGEGVGVRTDKGGERRVERRGPRIGCFSVDQAGDGVSQFRILETSGGGTETGGGEEKGAAAGAPEAKHDMAIPARRRLKG